MIYNHNVNSFFDFVSVIFNKRIYLFLAAEDQNIYVVSC